MIGAGGFSRGELYWQDQQDIFYRDISNQSAGGCLSGVFCGTWTAKPQFYHDGAEAVLVDPDGKWTMHSDVYENGVRMLTRFRFVCQFDTIITNGTAAGPPCSGTAKSNGYASIGVIALLACVGLGW